MVLDALASASPGYGRLLDAEEWLRAFSSRLCAEAGAARAAYRWPDPPELESCLTGAFEGKEESGRTRRGLKALSTNPNLNFGPRKVALKAPLDHGIRKSIRCVRDAVMPREVDGPDEGISDPKNASYAREAEAGVPDGTAVPSGAAFTIKQGARMGQDTVMARDKSRDAVR